MWDSPADDLLGKGGGEEEKEQKKERSRNVFIFLHIHKGQALEPQTAAVVLSPQQKV